MVIRKTETYSSGFVDLSDLVNISLSLTIQQIEQTLCVETNSCSL